MTLADTAVRAPAAGRQRRDKIANRVLIYAILIFLAVIFLTPLYTMVLTSLKTMPEIQQGNILALPQSPTFASWPRRRARN